jgi:hypothetical protein
LAKEPLNSKIRKVGRLMELKNEDLRVGWREYSGMDM